MSIRSKFRRDARKKRDRVRYQFVSGGSVTVEGLPPGVTAEEKMAELSGAAARRGTCTVTCKSNLGATTQEIADATGMTPAEVVELLQAEGAASEQETRDGKAVTLWEMIDVFRAFGKQGRTVAFMGTF